MARCVHAWVYSISTEYERSSALSRTAHAKLVFPRLYVAYRVLNSECPNVPLAHWRYSGQWGHSMRRPIFPPPRPSQGNAPARRRWGHSRHLRRRCPSGVPPRAGKYLHVLQQRRGTPCVPRLSDEDGHALRSSQQLRVRRVFTSPTLLLQTLTFQWPS